MAHKSTSSRSRQGRPGQKPMSVRHALRHTLHGRSAIKAAQKQRQSTQASQTSRETATA